MDYLIIDTETELAGPRGTAPPAFVVMGWRNGLGQAGWITNRGQAHDVVRAALALGEVVVAHNLVFDLEVLGLRPTVHSRVWCTAIADMLQRLAADDCDAEKLGSTSSPPRMRSLAKVLGQELEGKESTRLGFRPGVPLTEEQLAYLEQDVRAHETVFLRQRVKGVPGGQEELNLQVRALMALNQLSRTGFHVDRAEIKRQRAHLARLRRRERELLQAVDIYIPSKKGPRGGRYKARLNTTAFREHVEAAAGKAELKVERTDGGSVSVSSDFLLGLRADEVVESWLAYKGIEKLEGFLKAWDMESGLIHPGYRLMARTGRTTGYDPNLQQVPGRGAKGEVKRVFVAPPGRYLWEADYHQLELCTLAFLTRGTMLEYINAGRDLHRELAARFFRVAPDAVTKEQRQLAKAANFGFPGGMGVEKFRLTCRKQRIPDPGVDAARRLRDSWLETYPEMQGYLHDDNGARREFAEVWAGHSRRAMQLVEWRLDGGLVPSSGPEAHRLGTLAWQEAAKIAAQTSAMPRRIREAIKHCEGGPGVERWLVGREAVVLGGRRRWPVSYTEARNTPFQGLAANLTKYALARVVLDHPHLATVHAFVHDSLVFSTTQMCCGHQAALVVELMKEAAAHFLPGVLVKVELTGPGESWWHAIHEPTEI